MTICDVDELEQLADMDIPFEDLWSRFVTTPDSMRELVQQEFGSMSYAPHLGGQGVLGS